MRLFIRVSAIAVLLMLRSGSGASQPTPPPVLAFVRSPTPEHQERTVSPATPSLWQRYRGSIPATLGLLVLQSSLIVALLVSHAQRSRSAREIHQLNEKLSLRASELQTLIDVVPVGIAIAHDKAGRRITANAAFAQLVGSASARNTSVVSLSRGGKLVSVNELPMARAAAQGVVVRGEEIEVCYADGRRATLYGYASPVFDADRQVAGCIGALIDVSDRKRAERDGQEHLRELAHLSRVAALGELSGALAHELKQPLTGILANAQAAQRLVERQPMDLAEVRDSLACIVDDVRRASDVIRHTSALMKKGPVRRQPVDMNGVVHRVLELTHGELVARGIGVSAQLSPTLPPAFGDPVQLQQVLLNLVMNACDAMATVENEQRRLLVVTHANNGDVHLSVTDYGTGIPEGATDRVFQPFYTSKPQGLGLGLAICRSIVASHGGRLWAVNNPTRGATFHLLTPCASESAQVT